MDFKGIRTGITEGLTAVVNKVHGAIFSGPDLSEAAKKYVKAGEGIEYSPDAGDYGTFDTNSKEGREIIDEARHKLLAARTAYTRAYGNNAEMRSADDVLEGDFGIDVTQLIIDAQPAQAIIHGTPTQNSENGDVDHDEMRM